MYKLFLLTLCCLTLNIFAKDPFTLPKPEPNASMLIKMYYLDAAIAAKLIQQKTSGLLSTTGHLITEKKTNQLWVSDNKQHLKRIKMFIKTLDRPTKQILIKAKIILIDDTASKQLGVYFNTLQKQNSTQGQLSFPLIKLSNGHFLEIKLDALAKRGHALILSSPEIVANNHYSATIESGEQIPYQQIGRYGNTTLSFKKAVLSLKVTPTLLPHNKVTLSLLIYQNKPSTFLVNGTPAISTEKLNTQVTMSTQHTLILGGIHEQNFSTAQSHIPWIYKLPLIGRLFTTQYKRSQHKQLMVMITPSVLPET